MSASKQKGTKFETEVVNYLRGLADELGIGPNAAGIKRLALVGNQDLGDIDGFRAWVIQCKNQNTSNWAEWMDQTETQRVNAGVANGLLVVRRRMKTIDRAYAVMQLRQAAEIMFLLEDTIE